MPDNKSFVLRGIQDTAFEPRPIPEVSGNEVLVEVKKTGICGSDVHYLVHGRIGDLVVEKPMVLGHESSGVIAKVGSNVERLKVGQRVAIEPGATCRVCEACKAGVYELCPDIRFAATPPYDGTLGRYYKVPADLAYPLPDHLSLEDGAMMEPLSVAVHALVKLAGLRADQTVAVFGAGPVGLLCLAVAKAFGAKRVIAVDIVQSRLEFAKKYAATDIYLPVKKNKDESGMDHSRRNAQEMKKQFGIAERGSNAVDIVVDASGAEPSIQTSIFLVKEGGTFVQVGMGNPEVMVPITTLLSKQLTVKGSFRYGAGDYPLAISLVAQGKIDLKPLVTHRYPFEEAVAAFEVTRSGKSQDGKGVIKAIISGPDVPIHAIYRNARYLRLSEHVVLPLYVYVDERHTHWMTEAILGRVLEDLRPNIGAKLRAETRAKGPVETHRGDAYQFAYWFRKTAPHAVLIKHAQYLAAAAPSADAGADDAADEAEEAKPTMRLAYQGFAIHDRCLCVIIQPSEDDRRAAAMPRRTPLFLPEEEEEEEEAGDMMMALSQAMASFHDDERAASGGEEEDDDAGRAFLGDADEGRGMSF